MGSREATAFAVLPIVLGAIVFLPHWVYLGVVWVVTLLAAWELIALLHKLAHPAPFVPTLAAIGAALPALWLGGLRWSGPVLGGIVLLLPLVYLLARQPITGASAGIAGSVLTAAYFAVTGGAMGLLRAPFADPLRWKVVLLYCITLWAGDSGAYYLGSRFGKHRLAPLVSPKKSWEGVLGGTLLTFFGVWVCRTLFFPELPVNVGLALAVLLTVLAPLGDLVESLFKRDSGVKDSSGLIPGHGGFLDRTDSLFYAAPFVLALVLACGV
jgi:phosphatidate cytidylyltransferase